MKNTGDTRAHYGIKILEKIPSKVDSVVKFLLHDDTFGKNEVSVIVKEDKVIFCMPCQTNCKMGCKFCHLTGTNRPAKNLTSDWIVEALVLVHELYDHFDRDMLVSFMGAGEPLVNIENIKEAILRIPAALLEEVRFAICTMAPAKYSIQKSITDWMVANDHLGIRLKLHLSVHGLYNRKTLLPNSGDLIEAIDELKDYATATGMPIEYHYTLVNGKNDSFNELSELSGAISGVPATVKFLKLSENSECFASSFPHDTLASIFRDHTVEFYDPPGRDVGSSCGQFDKSIYEV